MSWLPGEIKKKVILFSGVIALANLGIENFNKDISKHFIASNFKLCQLITVWN